MCSLTLYSKGNCHWKYICLRILLFSTFLFYWSHLEAAMEKGKCGKRNCDRTCWCFKFASSWKLGWGGWKSGMDPPDYPRLTFAIHPSKTVESQEKQGHFAQTGNPDKYIVSVINGEVNSISPMTKLHLWCQSSFICVTSPPAFRR